MKKSHIAFIVIALVGVLAYKFRDKIKAMLKKKVANAPPVKTQPESVKSSKAIATVTPKKIVKPGTRTPTAVVQPSRTELLYNAAKAGKTLRYTRTDSTPVGYTDAWGAFVKEGNVTENAGATIAPKNVTGYGKTHIFFKSERAGGKVAMVDSNYLTAV